MTYIKRFFVLLTFTITTISATAQSNGSNSSYSRFGLGTLSDRSQGINRGMGGVAQGLRSGIQVNAQNPASYSAIDSLTFIFDAGMGLQVGRLKSGGTSMSAMNATLEYVNAGLRLKRGLGLSFGFLPYSSIGYNFSDENRVGTNYTTGKSITSTTTYYGNGGLHELYIGTGWNPFADFSIGVNIGYLWGDYDHSLAQQFYEGGSTTSNTAYNSQNEVWAGEIKTWRMDIGVQYPIQLNKKQMLTLGATAGIGHRIGSDVSLTRYTSQGDSIERKTTNAFELPYTIGAGATWKFKEQLTVSADYTLQFWDGCHIPTSTSTATSTDIKLSTNQYMNMHRITLGADYIHNTYGKYLHRMHFRLGGSYTTPYVKVNGQDGPSEMRLTAGVALPMKTGTRSLVNISTEWLRRSPSIATHITENYFLMHVGITFNEAWFMKRRFQ